MIVCGCSFHLHRIIAVTQLCQPETPNDLQIIDLIEKIIVAAIVQSETGSTEKVHLNGVLDGGRGVNKTDEFVRGKDVVGVGGELAH